MFSILQYDISPPDCFKRCQEWNGCYEGISVSELPGDDAGKEEQLCLNDCAVPACHVLGKM